MIQLIVKVSTKVIGSSVLLFPDCDQNDTIESIKLKISEQTGIPPEQQRLIVLGQLMLDENTLGFYNIKRGERTITLRDPLTTEGMDLCYSPTTSSYLLLTYLVYIH